MPLDVQRLIRSGLARSESPEACWAALLLWSQSWHEVPGASVPVEDATLASLAGYGRDMRSWARVRAGALRGWVECSDGRLYHPVVAEKALEAWLEKLAQRVSGGEGNARRWGIEFNRAAIDAQMAEARRLLAALNPDSRSLRKRRTAGIGSGSQPDSQRDRNRQGQGQGQGIENPRGPSDLLSGETPDAQPPRPKPKPKVNGARNGSAHLRDARELLAFLNERAHRRFPESDNNLGIIVARMKEGFTPMEIRQVIVSRARKWHGDPKMEEYLRPKTLFNRTNFANYVGELVEQHDPEPAHEGGSA